MRLGIRLDPHPYASFRVIIQIDTLITNSYQLAMLLNAQFVSSVPQTDYASQKAYHIFDLVIRTR